jgi:hypothetical protein
MGVFQVLLMESLEYTVLEAYLLRRRGLLEEACGEVWMRGLGLEGRLERVLRILMRF